MLVQRFAVGQRVWGKKGGLLGRCGRIAQLDGKRALVAWDKGKPTAHRVDKLSTTLVLRPFYEFGEPKRFVETPNGLPSLGKRRWR